MTESSLAAGPLQIFYTVSFPEAQAHYVDIEMDIKGLAQNQLTLKMPVWTPGSYLVREYAKNVESFTAEHNGKAVNVTKTRKNAWQIATQGLTSVKVKYRVYGNEISVRTNFIDASHGFLSPAGTFIYPDGRLNLPSTIHIKPYKNWDKVSTSLASVNNDAFTVTAPNYDILFDSPIEVGNQDIFGFDAAGVKYEVAMYGGGNYDKDRLKKDMTKIIEEETAIFGENPNKRYVFIVHNYQRGGGGLEHLSSTVLGASRDGYATESGYLGFLSLVAHEHFHLWNVKRLRPIALGPFDYDNENYTTNLWIAEGFTAYYDNLIVRRAQLNPVESYLKELTADMGTMDNTPGTRVQPLSQSSYDAWIKGYRPDENSINTGISYYTKGSIIGMLLDLEIINDTKGAKSLDDVMRYMYNEYYKTKKRGYTDAEFKAGLEKFAGKNLDDFYKKYINGVDPVNYDQYLGYAGYHVVNDLEGSNNPTLGATYVNAAGHVRVATVLRGTAAWKDGINVYDEITAIDGAEVHDPKTMLDGKKVADKISVSIIRDGLPMTIPVTLLRNTQVRYRIESLPNVTPQQMTVRNKWLKIQ
ncbi:M61 family metallopeptidase [Mucilaginibacter lacusdianchii]|uniref:M61 family metallopeptidase n=1 Tax=Mucilaginibacter lacusdianchii TaxID=2684211 RepID=UPI00131D5E83|nr:PDZ domain-containing protein [Mucilaginibacter sp. JXJ CY 39]